MGPFLFAIAIHEAIRRSKDTTDYLHPGRIDWLAFFLDDGTVAGEHTAVARFVSESQRALADIGLEVSLGKCEAISASGEALMF